MAIISMSKLTLIGLLSERSNILTAFSRTKNVQLVNIDKYELTEKAADAVSLQQLSEKMSQISGCLDFISYAASIRNKQLEKAKSKEKIDINTRKGGVEVKFDDLLSSDRSEYNLFSKIIDKAKINQERLSVIPGEISALVATKQSMKYFSGCDVKFSQLKDTQHTRLVYGLTEVTNEVRFTQLCDSCPQASFQLTCDFGQTTGIIAICHNDDYEQMNQALAKYSFVACNFNYDCTAKEKIIECNKDIANFEKETNEIIDTTLSYKQYIEQLQILYDYYLFNYQLAKADDDICRTSRTFILQAWLKTDDIKEVENTILSSASVCEFSFSDAGENDNPPIVTKNNKYVAPYETVTDMYSVPNYHEKDPNWAVSIFYLIFCGMILGDAGYGILLAIGAFIILKFFKPKKGDFKNLLYIFGFGGISAIFWGTMFGGWFSTDIIAPVLFSPLNNPLETIGLCLAFGVIHILFGVAIKAAAYIRAGLIVDAICDCFTWIIFLAGLLVMAVGALVIGNSLLTNIGLYSMLGSLIVIALTNGRKAKSIIGKVVGGVSGVYGVINYMSDILSYLRLFGLCLAGGVIGMVFNIVGGLFLGSPISFILGVAIIVVGHGLNLALSLLGIYVHNGRLQHIEFFGKFYIGDGLRFRPLGGETKYITTN